MANDYFDAADYTALTAHTLARAANLNTILSAVETGFDKLPSEDNTKKGIINFAVDTGTADAYIVSLPHNPSTYTDGLLVEVRITNTNLTTTSTINANSIGVANIKRFDGTAIAIGDLVAGAVVQMRYNLASTEFRIVGVTGADATSAATSATNAATSATNAATSETNADADATATAADKVSTNADVVTTNADVVLTNADVVLTNADVVTVDSATGALANKFTFAASTTMGDPGTGTFRLNNATVGSVTAIAFDAASADTGNPDISDYIATWGASDSTVKGHIVLRKSGTPATFAVFTVGAAVTDNTGWLQVTVTHVDSAGTWSASDTAFVQFIRAGDKGAAGAGDLTSTNNLSDVANAATAFSNIKQAATKTATGVVELATTAETATGTDSGRAVTPDGLHDMTSLSGAAWMLDEDNMASNSATKVATQQSIKAYADLKLAKASNLSDVATAATALSNLGGIGQGKHTQYYPVSLMTPTASNGCAARATHETTAGRPDIVYMALDASVDEHAQWNVVPPKKWNGGTITFRGHWTVNAAVTTGIGLALQGIAIDNDETQDVAYGTAVVITDDALNAAEDMHITGTSGVVTIGGVPDGGGDEHVAFRVFRDVSDANDDMTQDMWLQGVEIDWTLNAVDDT